MLFRTQIPIEKQTKLIDYDSKMMFLGSCFAVTMSTYLREYKFQNQVNPFGIVFHPLAIENFLQVVLEKKGYTENDIFFHNERWHCFETHSDRSSTKKEDLLELLNHKITHTYFWMSQVTHIMITLGTAWVYKHKTTNRYVANCHKIPQEQFVKELLSVEEISRSLEKTSALIHTLSPQASIIFTVSPVRHSKDGFVENQRSKAHLITALHQVLRDNITYFPSYEIMMDELRDYRFYSEDMLHPNKTAVDYIWQQFKKSAINDTCFDTMQDIEGIQKGLAHKPFDPDSMAYKKFRNVIAQKIKKLTDQYPFMEF